MTGNLSFLVLIALALLSCGYNPAGTTETQPDKDCLQKKTIEGLGFYFNHFPYAAMDTIQIKVGGGASGKEGWKNYSTDRKLIDSLREQRYFYFEKKINITDTVFFKLKQGGVHAAYGFRYLYRPHSGSASIDYGCDFYELYLDGEKQTGGIVSLVYGKK